MKMNEMFYALTDFCINQDNDKTASEDIIAEMIGGLLSYCDRCAVSFENAAEKKYRYRFLNFGRDNEKIIPQYIRDNDILCEKGITLCCVNTIDYPMGNKTGISGYEIVYDCDKDVIRLFYKATYRENEVITVYRTETDIFSNFDFFGFYAELTKQLKSSIDEICAA